MKKSGNIVKTIIVVIIMIGLIIGFYFAISSRNSGNDTEEVVQTKSEESLLRRDLEKDYPLTPTAVVSYYSDLVLAYYNDDCEDSVREELFVKSRNLYDEELLENNSEKEQWLSLQEDIEAYIKNKKQIIKYTMCETNEVDYGDLDGADVALLYVTYRVRDKKDLKDINEEYFLRKDEEGLWKIVGWQLQTNKKN